MPQTGSCDIPTGRTETTVNATILNNNILLSWDEVASASEYLVKYKLKNTNNFFYVDTNSNSLTLPYLLQDTTYEWYVKANCNGLISSFQTTPEYFNTQSGCNFVEGLNAFVSQNEAQLNWNEINNAETYYLKY